MTVEFDVSGRTYRAGTMDAMTQWNVVRRLSPLVSPLINIGLAAKGDNDRIDLSKVDMKTLASTGLIDIAAKALANLSDEDSEYILSACLSLCERQTTDKSGWAMIWNKQAKRPQFNDLNMGIMLQITIAVLKDNLSGFFPELRSLLSEGEAK